MIEPSTIIGIVKELSERCDSDSHLSEELENARISPADLANNLLTALESLEAMKTRNTEGIEKMYSKMCELDTHKRGELHLLLLSLFS